MEAFEEKLVLVEYLYETFGADSFEEFRDALGDVEPGFGPDDRSQFATRIAAELDPADPVLERLDDYDRNIAEYERRLDADRTEPIELQYFQYLALLFTEVYLDRYFNARETLRDEFSALVEDTRSRLDADDLYSVTGNDLGKLAYWMATGSGKTLVMHANLWQFRRYADQDVENVLLITPTERLTDQHLAEFEASGIAAERFRPDRNSTTEPLVSVLDIHKLSDETGEKTFDVDLFEGDNLVFVDEGHKGAQGDTWIQHREQVIGDDGFSFEYSATFGQALRATDNEQLQNRYVKAILFDYSFRNFHADGFGKEYDILNLADDDRERRETYLTANLLAFYEQKRYFEENERALARFNLEDPLWVFVGQTVTAVSSSALTKQDKASDVEAVVRYLDRFLSDRTAMLGEIDEILSGSTFVDEEGNRLFDDRFEYLNQSSLTAEEMYDDILSRLFNTTAATGLTLVRLRNTDGEIGLRAGRTGPYFGVISIGSPKRFLDRIEEHTDITVEDQAFQGSLFGAIDTEDSEITVLIGAKKFAEGWDSYRVASMGLMRVGRSEGSEIIQIFGRGIRLRGKDHSLKRTSHLSLPETEVPDDIEILERLNVFGIKADYIEEFETQLAAENIPTGYVERTVSTEVDSDLVDDGLKVPRVQADAEYTAETVQTLRPSEEYMPFVDLYPSVQTLRSQSATGLSAEKHTVSSDDLATSLVDWDAVFLDVLEYKRRRGYSNLIVDKATLREIIVTDLFRLRCPPQRLDGPNLAATKERTEEILTTVLRSYLDNVFSVEKSRWEDTQREYQTIEETDAELNVELTFRVPDDDGLVETLDDILAGSTGDSEEYTVDFDRSLYHPLFVKTAIEDQDSSGRLKAPAQSLNDDERRLVERLADLCAEGRLAAERVYLLRNPRNSGVGFEEGGYPDFLLWITDGTTQKLLFLDPHGLIFEPADIAQVDKVKLSRRLEELSAQLDDPTVEMASYVVAVTDEEALRERFDDVDIEEYERHNVYLQTDDYLARILEDAGVPLG